MNIRDVTGCRSLGEAWTDAAGKQPVRPTSAVYFGPPVCLRLPPLFFGGEATQIGHAEASNAPRR